MTTEPPATFGDLLRHARRDAGLTQAELAKRAGLSTRAISDLERGINRAPRRDTLEMLADALGLTVEDRAHWERARRRFAVRSAQSTAKDAIDTHQSTLHLPTPLTGFVGREHEIGDVRELVLRPETRLLTLTGAGGVGKTRLALEVARAMSTYYPDGVWFVDLAPLNNPDLVLPAIATTLGVTVSGQQTPSGALALALRNSVLLLILDNVEQIAASAPEVGHLLDTCPKLTILATSRVPMHLQCEREYPVEPLELPDLAREADVEGLKQFAAILLFAQRAQAIKPDFQLTFDNTRTVAEICQRLDGLPLAIELAAARVRLLPPSAMLQRLERRLPFLIGRNLDMPARHLALHSAIQWSYDLLSPEEQRLFQTLSVFVGGWDLDAADAVADDRVDVLNGLEALIDQSFVRVRERSDGSAHYTLMETIREFGLEQLALMDDSQEIHRRHATYFMTLVEQAAPHLKGVEQAQWMTRLENEHANFRAALQWTRDRATLGDSAAITIGLRLAASLWWFWYAHGHLREGRDQLTTIVEVFRAEYKWPESRVERAELENAYATALFGLGALTGLTDLLTDYNQFWLPLRESLEIYRQLGQKDGIASVLIWSGYAMQRFEGDFDQAESLFREGIAIYQDLDDNGGVALGLLGLGEMTLRTRDYAQSDAWLTGSEQLFNSIADRRGTAAARDARCRAAAPRAS